jgi:hypothetical protein
MQCPMRAHGRPGLSACTTVSRVHGQAGQQRPLVSAGRPLISLALSSGPSTFTKLITPDAPEDIPLVGAVRAGKAQLSTALRRDG